MTVDRWDLSPLEAQTVAGLLGDARRRATAISGTLEGAIPDLSVAQLSAALRDLGQLHLTLRQARALSALHAAADQALRPAAAQVHRETAAISAVVAFMGREWAALPAETSWEHLNDPSLAFCSQQLCRWRRSAEHRLSDDAEHAVSALVRVNSAGWVRLHDDSLSSVRVSIDGAPVGLDEALTAVRSPVRSVRRQASERLGGELAARAGPLAAALRGVVSQNSAIAELRGRESWMSGRLTQDDIPVDHVRLLVETVRGRYDVARRWWRIKADLLGIDEFSHFDRMAPLQSATDPWTIHEAALAVTEMFADLDARLGDLAARAFAGGWIDAQPRPEKQPGAACWGTVPEAHPYVLLNFGGSDHDVLTVAHELAHALHLSLAADQGVYHDVPPAPVAEVFAVLAERRMLEHLANASPAVRRRGLLALSIDTAIANIFRQVAVHLFEDSVHSCSDDLTPGRIQALWLQAKSELHGDDVKHGELFEHWWSFIPHLLRTPGYAVSYAFGQLLALSLQELDNAPRLIQMLQAGGSAPPAELLPTAGVDPSRPQVWAHGISRVEALIDDFEESANGGREPARRPRAH